MQLYLRTRNFPLRFIYPSLLFLFSVENCAELNKCGQTISGVYAVDLNGVGAFNIYIVTRQLSVDDRKWSRRGCMALFTSITPEKTIKGIQWFPHLCIWLGLDNIERLTQNKTENKLLVILGVRASKIVHAAYEWFGIENMKADNKLRISSIFKHSYMVMHITLMNPADLSTSSLWLGGRESIRWHEGLECIEN